MENELEKAWQEAYSIESREGHGADDRDIKYIGHIQNESRIYLFYKDTNGDYWYRVKIQTPEGIFDEQAIFGKGKRR